MFRVQKKGLNGSLLWIINYLRGDKRQKTKEPRQKTKDYGTRNISNFSTQNPEPRQKTMERETFQTFQTRTKNQEQRQMTKDYGTRNISNFSNQNQEPRQKNQDKRLWNAKYFKLFKPEPRTQNQDKRLWNAKHFKLFKPFKQTNKPINLHRIRQDTKKPGLYLPALKLIIESKTHQ